MTKMIDKDLEIYDIFELQGHVIHDCPTLLSFKGGLDNHMMHKFLPIYNELVQEFYAHLEPLLGNQPVYSLVRGLMVPFMRQKILNAIPIYDILEEEPSFSGKVNNTPTGSPSFKELCSNHSNYAYNIGYMKSELLKNEFMLLFLFSKYNITSLFTTIERDAHLILPVLCTSL